MDAAGFAEQLRRKRFSPAYLLLGRDLYLRELCRDRLIEAAVPAEARELAVVRLSLKEISLGEVLRQAQTLPMLSPRQVLVVSEVERATESDVEMLESYFRDPNRATVLVFEAERLDQRTRLARLLLEHCSVLDVESPEDEAEVRAAVERFAGEKGLRLDPVAAEELVFAVGNDLSALRRELEKLRAYVGPGRTARVEDVTAVVAAGREFEIFELVDLLAENRRAESLARTRRLLEAGESAIGIVGLLAWLYRQLLQVQALPRGTSLREARRRLGGAPEGRVAALLQHARRFSHRRLQQALPLLFETDRGLKSSPPDATTLLETLIVRLTSRWEERAAVRS